MDERVLRARLEAAVSDEPPIGNLVGHSLREGHRRRRRRRTTAAASLSAVAVVVAGAVSGLVAGADHSAGRPRPAASRQPGKAGTAYIATFERVTPISPGSSTPGTPIRVQSSGVDAPFETGAAAGPDGQTIYVMGQNGAGGTTVTPIDTATSTAEPAITLTEPEPTGIAVAPDGKTVYVATARGVVPISTTTRTAGQPIFSRNEWWQLAFTPNGRTLYALGHVGALVGVIRTAGNKPVKLISLPDPVKTAFAQDIAVTPNGKTAYVVEGVAGGKPGASSVVPINVATNRPLTPIRLGPSGMADGLVIAPDGQTAYVLSSRAVTPINTATNQAEPFFSLPASAGSAYYILIAPNGKTLYVFTPRGVIPIETATGKVLPIIGVPKMDNFADAAITPDGKTIYVGAAIWGKKKISGHLMQTIVGGGVVPISTATNTAGRFINLGGTPFAFAFRS
jgi:DNA-binding beta-propeller fold protein YncE